MGRDFRDLEAQAAATRTESGCSLGNNSWAYPYGTFYDPDNVCSPSPSREVWHDIVVYVHTEGENRAIGSLQGIFVCSERIVLDPGELIPCRRDQMPDFEKKYKGRFIPFEDK